MSKKSLSILFLSLACLIHLGHSLFPHSHVEAHHHDEKHQHHHHDENSDESGLSILFSHYGHRSDTFSTTHIGYVAKIIKEVPNQVAYFQPQFSYLLPARFYSRKELVRNKEPLIFISPHLHSFQLRGPPNA